jgi:hypothetical protein
MAKKYDVISPDGFPITCRPFPSKKAAVTAIPLWCARFKEQGYYSTSNRKQIPLSDLPFELSIVPEVEWRHCC